MKGNPAESNAKLAGAKQALKDKLMNAVLQQAIQELGSPTTIADALVDEASKTPEFEQASKSLFQRVVAEIEAQSISSLADPTVAAEAIFKNIRDRSNLIPDAVSSIRMKLIEAIHTRSMEQISDPSKLSGEAFESFDRERSEIVEATARLRSRLLDDITSRAAESVSDFDAVARELSDRLGSDTTIVHPIVGHLRTLLLSRIEERAIGALDDADGVARSIAENVSDDNDVIEHAAEVLRKKLVHQVESKAFDSVRDPEALSLEIQASFDSIPAEVEKAVDRLHNELIQDIRNRGIKSISNAENVAEEARKSIDDQDERILAAHTELAARLLEEVTNSAISELSEQVIDAEAVSLDELPGFGDETVEVSNMWSKTDSFVASALEPQDPQSESSLSDFSDQQWSDDFVTSFEDIDVESMREHVFADESEAGSHSEDPLSKWGDPEDEITLHDTGVSDDAIQDEHVHVVEQPFVSPLSANDAADFDLNVETPRTGPSIINASDQPLEDDSGPDAIYVYGILSESTVPDELPSEGIDPGRHVEIVGYGPLRAAVTHVPVSEFSGENFKSQLQNKEWLKEKVRLHSKVLDSLNSGRTIIPMRFCTVYRNESEVLQILERNEDHYRSVLHKIDGKQEWSVRIYRDEAKLSAKVAESDRIVETSLGSISKGIVDFVKEEMDRLNKIEGEQAIELMSQHCSSRSHAALMECASDGIFKPFLNDNGQNNSDVVLNAAYLVLQGNEDKLRDEIERLASEYSELGFRFDVHGPWPPYHFVGEPSKVERSVSA